VLIAVRIGAANGHLGKYRSILLTFYFVQSENPHKQMAEFRVNGEVLAWARKIRGIGAAEAARRLGLSEAELLALETGRPLVEQSTLRKISKKYKVSYGSLFMPAPLPIDKPKQYRTFRGSEPQLSERTTYAWREVSDAIDSFADIQLTEPQPVPSQAIRKITRRDDVEKIATAERVRLRVTLSQQRVWTDAQARDGWRSALESVGVFVYFISMPVADCMGFSVFDEREIPAICVNDNKDLLERQKIFSLLHEYCHLLLRQPGISDEVRSNAVEHYCNQFAAALLIPSEALKRVLPGGGPKRDWTTKELRRVANRFTVSMEALAIRIEELRLSSPGFHARKIAEWSRLGLLKKKRKKGHANVSWADRAARRLGQKHTSTVFTALDHGTISFIEARGLIGLPAKHFPAIRTASR
jgi:Zn-dependent peptidase ImmA (M78 family)/transcriptional regulator with XRE-family HTH domain